ncbi:MAG: glucuronate isomerase [Chloroflexi bacterium]|nr:glucuronate isomerase [Chloroflexota bacterium]
MVLPTWNLSPDRFFDPDPTQRRLARMIYQSIADLPIVAPHGHVDPRVFADPNYSFGNPAEMIIIPDHYIFRMLYSQGVPLESVGVPRRDGGPVEQNPRRIWQIFADHFHLFRGTPTGIWLAAEFSEVFGIEEKLTSENAQDIYDQIQAKLNTPEFRPRALYERFNIEVLTTTDAATDTLEHHRRIQESDWRGDIRPTFRPDAVVNIDTEGWREHIERLAEVSGVNIHNYASYIQALEQRRAFFKQMGATATDHAALTAYTERLSRMEAEVIFQKALAGQADEQDARRFTAHMIMEMARMSIEDGLVMQFHVGSLRNHNRVIYERFGPDKGADIPVRSEFTRNLRPLLNAYGNDTRLRLILFALDESAYSRELAPLAGHYPALFLGPPWWFFDSIYGMIRYREMIHETAGLYNTVGFNDDTRAYPSIPVRHDVWRRVESNWLAGLVVRGVIDEEDAMDMARASAYELAKTAYRLDKRQN